MKYLFITMILLFCGCLWSADDNLIPDGEFQQASDNASIFKGWFNKSGKWMLEKSGENKWAKLDGKGSVQYDVKIDPEWATLKVSCRMKTTGAIKGEQNWQTARVAFEFIDSKRKHVGDWPKVPWAIGDKDWFYFEEEYRIPSGAAKLKVMPANMGNGGIVEFDDLVVKVGRIHEPVKDLPAPTGFTPDPDLKTAWRAKSATQEKICLNSLWQFQPAKSKDSPLPKTGSGWGWFKIPGIWPTREDYSTPPTEQKILLCDAMIEGFDPLKLKQAWYKRNINIPADWGHKKIEMEFTMLQSYAKALIDGQEAGELLFPGGKVDLSKFIKPGKTQQIAILVCAMPLAKDRTVFMAPGRSFTEKGDLKLKGITGDLYLLVSPSKGNLTDIRARTSFRNKNVTFDMALEGINIDGHTIEFTAAAANETKTFAPVKLTPDNMKNNRLMVTVPWENPKLWDTDSPQNMYEAIATIKDKAGAIVAQSLPKRFGFREFWIDGRDFYLNGKRIHLRALVLDNMNMAAGRASKQASRESMKRLKAYGFNFFITHNYNFAPGSVGYMDGMLQAADEEGVLCAFSMPHIKDFAWNMKEKDIQDRYRSLVDKLVELSGNHPSIVTYTMNHNSCGYKGDQNPLFMDGKFDPNDPATGGVPSSNREQALIAAGICKEVDPSRPVYHHSSGNLGDMYTINIYLDWAPRQERSDWLEHWEKEGVKPVFFVEWGLPHNASWSSYRGPHFIWRTPAFQHAWTSEFAAADMGQDAYNLSSTNLRAQQNENDLFAKGKVFTWSSLSYFLRQATHNYLDVQAWYAADNWRSHRARGLSAGLPWDQEGLWKREGNFNSQEGKVNEPYANISQPGIIPDMIKYKDNYLYAPTGVTYKPSILGKTFLRWNMPLCAFIGGKPGDFSEKKHIYYPGETINKTFVIINDTRKDISCKIYWSINGTNFSGTGNTMTEAGNRSDHKFELKLPQDIKAGQYKLQAEFAFSNGSKQNDEFTIDIISSPVNTTLSRDIFVYDPAGNTMQELKKLGVKFTHIDKIANVSPQSILIIGQKALKLNDNFPGVMDTVKNGARVIIFEQNNDILRDRFGMRTNIHGMRTVYLASGCDDVLSQIDNKMLRDWSGSSTTTEPYLKGATRSDPQWNWMGFDNTRVWRCGNRGNVASVLPEKPVVGNFTPLLLCGFDMQYSPLLRYTTGKGIVIICQLDVTARSESSPAAQKMILNIIKHVDKFSPDAKRDVFFSGNKESEGVLKKLGITHTRFDGKIAKPENALLILGTGYDKKIKPAELAANGTNIFALGLNAEESKNIGISGLDFKKTKTLPSYIEKWEIPAFTGLGNQDIFWRGELEIAAISGNAGSGNEVLRAIKQGKGTIVLSQAAPWMFEEKAKTIFRKSLRRNYSLVSQLLRNLGADEASPFLNNLENPSKPSSIELPAKWVGLVDKENAGRDQKWYMPEHDIRDWKPIKVPGMFDAQIPELSDYDGLFWYRLDFSVPDGVDGDELNLFLGAVDDESWVWLNGEFIGEVSKKTNPKDYYRVSREYALKKGSLKPGQKNTLIVLVNDTYLKGGMRSKPALRSTGKWLSSYYVQAPVEGDDPYRYYRW